MLLTHNSKDEEIPRQPSGSGFPLYLYSYEDDGKGGIRHRRPFAAAGLTSLSVAFAAGVCAYIGKTNSTDAFTQNFLSVTMALAGAGGLSLFFREKVIEHQQLIYFRGPSLVVDSFGQKLQYFDMPDVKVDMVNIYGNKDGGGNFLQVSDRHGKRAYIGAFLPEEDLYDIFMAINRGLERHPSRRLGTFKERYEAKKNRNRGSGEGPRSDLA